ncbi:hypothetical protein C8J57DRAFT_1482850 [Mycena rebaudengoi]|nr:hypothetical protein C8J57DRAFT_1482850 [Mycena rebaudengoi]
MRFSQEIVDAIIDKVADTSGQPDVIRPTKGESSSDALRACALAARALLPRSRQHLFSTISCRSRSDWLKFDRLLAESPQIGELYVRHLTLGVHGHRDDPHASETEILVPRILRLLPNLTHLGVNAIRPFTMFRVPEQIERAIHETFSLPSLRSVCITGFMFHHVWALESLLSHATGLKELSLNGIRFDKPSVVRPVDHPSEGRIVLESVRLEDMSYAVVIIAANFTVVDVQHLHYLEVIGAPVMPLLKASAQTIQEVRSSYSNVQGWTVDQNILEGNTTLHYIEISHVHAHIVFTLRQFGHLGHLTALKTISLHFNHTLAFDDISDKAVDWPALDATIALAGVGLEDVRISAYSVTGSQPDLALVRERLPSVAGHISVHK